jgi:hypothetical protein
VNEGNYEIRLLRDLPWGFFYRATYSRTDENLTSITRWYGRRRSFNAPSIPWMYTPPECVSAIKYRWAPMSCIVPALWFFHPYNPRDQASYPNPVDFIQIWMYDKMRKM